MHLLIGAFFNAAILGLAAVIVGVLFGRLHPLIDIFAHFLLAATVGAIAMALLAAVAGRTATVLIFLGLAAVAAALAWPWIHPPERTAATGPHFTLMTFNVYYNNKQLERVAELVRETKPDIVVLMEVIPRVRPGLEAVAKQYPYRVECWQEQWCDALVLSRFPLTDIRSTLPEATFRRPMGAVEMTIEGRKLTIFPTHLSLPYPLNGRDAQTGEIKEVVATIAGISGPRLLVGDFNASTWGATMMLARTQLNMTLLTGSNGTWPTFLPRALGIPIDHVLASEELALQSRKLFTVSGSDHRAVLAEIAFKE
jgi:endonuclease/exonuclease/phosphatase (EEP) superfamily protein YafD